MIEKGEKNGARTMGRTATHQAHDRLMADPERAIAPLAKGR
ncbi:MAG: hypothetical protein OEZ14_12360 [Acidimicrobiia bacterium]|nr:hypothetical protein [Acidimicrobiia bacterium]